MSRFPLLLFLAVLSGLSAQEVPDSGAVMLRYRHRAGDVLHADALVRERVFINGHFSHDAEIAESSISRVLDVSQEGTAALESEFITTERIAGVPGLLDWISSESVGLSRDSRGRMNVPDGAGRPVLRDIPVFPEEPVAPGDRWSADAREVHIFRIDGRLWGPYRGDFPVSYTLEGYETVDGRPLARIRIEYNLHLPVRRAGEPVRMVSGTSQQLLYWDADAGEPVRKEETFEFVLLMSSGTSQEIMGAQTVVYRTLPPLNRRDVLDDLGRALDEGVILEEAGEGIRLIIDETDRILFAPESAEISPGQQVLLRQLAAALRNYRDRDILITGHTADYGTPEGRHVLSRERAEAVAGILFPGGRDGTGRLYVRGRGAEEPVGTDAENRRVEILILD